MNLDSSLSFAEVRSLEHAQTMVNGRRVESIELPMQFELLVKLFTFSKTDHFVGKLFEYPVFKISLGVGKVAKFDLSATKSQMVTLILDGINVQMFTLAKTQRVV